MALDLIYTVWDLAIPFLVLFSFLDSTISGHVTQISDFLRYRLPVFPRLQNFGKF